MHVAGSTAGAPIAQRSARSNCARHRGSKRQCVSAIIFDSACRRIARHGSRTPEPDRRLARRISRSAPPSCGGIFDFDVKAVRLAEVDARARRSEDLGRPAARAGARQGKEAARRRRRHADAARRRPRRTARELFELARADGDDATLDGGRRATSRAREAPSPTSSSGGCSATRWTRATCFIDIQAGIRRHRGAGLGGDARCGCTSATASARAIAPRCSRSRRAKSPASRARRSRSTATTRTATCAPRSACIGSCARARSTRTRAGTRRSRASSSIRKSTTRSRSTSIRPICASTRIARRAPAASTSTRPTPRCASRTCRRTSSSSARTTARSTATAPRRWRC